MAFIKAGRRRNKARISWRCWTKPSIANPKQSISLERFYFWILDWLTTCNIPMRQATSEKFHALFDDVSLLAASYLRTGDDFIPKLVRKAEKCFQQCVAQTLTRARGKINVTCDIWKSDNDLSVLGVIASLHWRAATTEDCPPRAQGARWNQSSQQSVREAPFSQSVSPRTSRLTVWLTKTSS